MKHPQPMDKYVSYRLPAKQHAEFVKKSAKFGGASALIREFIEAFNEDRMTITPHPDKEKLYVTRSKD